MTHRKELQSLSEAQLISRVVILDDHGAFNEIVIRYQNDVRNLLLKLVNFNELEVDDLYQEVFIKVYKNLKSFRGKSAFSTWIYQITYRTFIDKIKAKAKYQKTIHNSTEMEPSITHPNIGSTIDAERMIMSLEPTEKAAIQLSYINGLSHKEIATVMECSIGVVKGHIAKGKKRIREIFNKEYGK